MLSLQALINIAVVSGWCPTTGVTAPFLSYGGSSMVMTLALAGLVINVAIRNMRRDAIEELKKLLKNGLSEDIEKDKEAEVQKIHDAFMKKVDEMFAAKEKDIMTVETPRA